MRVAVIGLGLIGGSIALGLKKRLAGKDLTVIGIPRQEETLKKALGAGAIDSGTTDPKKGVADADIVFICTPMNLILPVLKDIVPALKKGAVVTDVGSTKAEIVAKAEKLMPKGVYFVGGHPMAGKEATKFEAAEAELFADRIWVLTRTPRTNHKALFAVGRVAGLLGARTVEMDPQVHDLAVAAISHAPLAVAASLVNAVAEARQAGKEMKICAASGFRDTTRVASGDPVLGVDMFTTNKKAVIQTIAAFKKTLDRLEKLIRKGDADAIAKELRRAKAFRDSIYGGA